MQRTTVLAYQFGHPPKDQPLFIEKTARKGGCVNGGVDCFGVNLESLFLVVFVGEFSTGKSTIINAIIGEKSEGNT